MTVRVKVCGITSYEDAVLCLDCGADALGFNFYRPSPRYIDPLEARTLIRRLPPLTTTVGVFVNVERPSGVAEIALAAGVHVLQLHGDETPSFCRELAGWTLIKAVRIADGKIDANLLAYPVHGFLLDSKDELLFGGTGKAFDWSIARKLGTPHTLILAGGLGPANVAQAIRTVGPYAVDVCSGVENSPGRKDAGKLKAFMEEVKKCRK